jgi:hypothetical protein
MLAMTLVVGAAVRVAGAVSVPQGERDSADTKAGRDSLAHDRLAKGESSIPGSSGEATLGQPDTPDNGPDTLTIAALGLGLVGCAVGGVVFWLARSLDKSIDDVVPRVDRLERSVARLQPESPLRAEVIAPRSDDVRELMDRLHYLERLVGTLQNEVRGSAAAAIVDASRRSESAAAQDLHSRSPSESQADVPRKEPDSQSVGGDLGQDATVKRTSSSKPMVEIRWRDGDARAEVRVNPEYRFADVTARYLESVFDVDVPGQGSFETLSPAIVEWTPDASSGRVVSRGRLQAIGR